MQKKIYVFYAHHSNPAGGALATCRFIKALNEIGYDATLMYKCDRIDPMPLIPCSNDIPRIAWNPTIITSNDIMVVSEVDGNYIREFDKSIQKVVFNQSPALMFAYQNLSLGNLSSLYNSSYGVTDMICISDHAISAFHPFLSQHISLSRIHHYSDFLPKFPKKFQIAYQDFKCPEIKEAILNKFPDIPKVPINWLSHEEVGKILQESLFFLDWSTLGWEGFGLSAFEAMSAGCVLLSNMWPAAQEFMQSDLCYSINTLNDWELTIPTFNYIINRAKKDQSSVEDIGKKAAEFIHNNYNEDIFRNDLKQIWETILKKNV